MTKSGCFSFILGVEGRGGRGIKSDDIRDKAYKLGVISFSCIYLCRLRGTGWLGVEEVFGREGRGGCGV